MKTEVEHTRLTVGGNLVDYPGDISTKMADLTTAKILFNNVLSTPNAKFMGIDLKTIISTPPWIDMNICNSPSKLSRTRSHNNTTCYHPSTTASCI
jgi:hypothetical protein